MASTINGNQGPLSEVVTDNLLFAAALLVALGGGCWELKH